MPADHVGANALISILFSVIGFVMLFIGFRVFDILTPSDLNKRIFEEGNVAAAILTGAFVIAMAIVVASAIS